MKQYLIGAIIVALCALSLVAGHEVYVLNSTEITSGFADRSVDVLDALDDDGAVRTLIACTGIGLVLFVVLSYLIHTKLSKHLDVRFATMRKYAHFVIRVGLGTSFAWGAWHNSIFGPEIPLESIPGGLLWKPVLFVAGLMIITGFFTRLAALICLAGYIAAAMQPSQYALNALNYVNYLGEIAVLLIERGELYSVDRYMRWKSDIFHRKLPEYLERLKAWGEQHSFLVIRVTYGVALIYAGISIKLLSPALSVQVLRDAGIEHSVLVSAIFFVLAAGIVELLLGFSLIFGVLYRPMLFVLTVFIAYSVWYFGEEVWPHAILLAASIGLFLHGKDKWCYEDRVYGWILGWTRRWRKSKAELSPS